MKLSSRVLVIAEPLVQGKCPGGIKAWLDEFTRHKGAEQCLACEGDLVVLSDPDDERLKLAHDQLHAVVGATSDAMPPCVLVDPIAGPMTPCAWVRVDKLTDGSVTVLYTGPKAAGEAAAKTETSASGRRSARGAAKPRGSASRARSQKRCMPEGPSLVKLSEENGITTWLDVSTGRQLTSAVAAPQADATADAPTPRLDAAVAMITERQWHYERDDDDDVRMKLDLGPFMALSLAFIAAEHDDVLMFIARIPGRVTTERRAPVLQYLAGANWGLEVGSFDMDCSDGEVVYRAAIIAHEGRLHPSACAMALDRSMATIRRYAAGLIEVATGGDPTEVLKRVDA